jgi:autotransporter-associated beta strand protein
MLIKRIRKKIPILGGHFTTAESGAIGDACAPEINSSAAPFSAAAESLTKVEVAFRSPVFVRSEVNLHGTRMRRREMGCLGRIGRDALIPRPLSRKANPRFPRTAFLGEYAGFCFFYFVFSLPNLLRRYNMNRRLFLGIAMIAIAFSLPAAAFADTHTWQGPTGDPLDYNWSTAANWTPAGPPAAGTSGDYAYITNGTTVEFNANGGARYMYIGEAAGNGALHIPTGSTSTFSGGSYFEVGRNVGNGTLTQDGGTITMPNHFYVGSRVSGTATFGTGTYNMNGGSLGVGGTFVVGSWGAGTVNQTGGTVSHTKTDGTIGIGSTLGGTLGTWDMTGGVLNGPTGTGIIRVALNQNGILKARGTASVVTNNLAMGTTTSTATVPLTADINVEDTASVTVNNVLTMNDAAAVTNLTATLRQSGGTLTVGTLARGAGIGTTEYDLSGGSLILGAGASGTHTIGTLIMTGGVIDTNQATAPTLTSTGNYNMQGGIVKVVLAGGVGLDKTGPGLVTLTAANTYTGDTTIGGGTLDLLGSLTSKVSVGDQSTLKGAGSIVGDVVAAAGSTIEPGDSIGTLTLTGNVALGGTLDVEYDGAAAAQKIDLLAVNGNLDLTGATFDFAPIAGGSPLSGEPHVFVTYTGTLTGMAGGTAPTGYKVDYGTPGQIALTLVPEPSTWIMLILAGLALTAYKRRRA